MHHDFGALRIGLNFMDGSEELPFSSVLTVNPYKESYCEGVFNTITPTTQPKYGKEQLVVSYLHTKDFITAQLEISKNIPDEDIYDALSSKAYDELALDQAVEYKIQYVEIFNTLDEDNRHFHVFIVDPLDLTNTFSNVVKKVKYIDTITPVPLLLKALYTKDIVELSGVHCYIYLQESDAFLTLYNDKEFLYTKSIKYSFLDMHERFCELYGERIDYENFLNFFTKENLKESQSNYKTYIIKLYKELFANINDILTYAKRAFEIEKIDQVYIGSQIETVTQLDEMLEAELQVKAAGFEFDYGFENQEGYIDQLHALLYINAHIPSEERYHPNFTIYRRPPKFIYRDSGRLITAVVASLILAFAYPVTYWILTYAQELQKDLLQQEYKEVHSTKVTRETTIKNRLTVKEKSQKLLEIQKQQYTQKRNTLIKVHDVKVNYPMKAALLSTIYNELTKFGVQTTRTTYNEDEKGKVLALNLATSKDRRITKLLEYLTKTYEGKYKFELEKISYDPKTKMYLSEMKVVLL